MALATVISYDPTNKTVTVAGDVASAQLLSIVNQTAVADKDIFVVGQTAITNRVYSGGNTTFTFAGITTTGHNASDILAVRYQASISTMSLASGVIIGNSAYFNQATNPTQRLNGALQVGDRNYRTDLNVDTFWNGTYWLGVNQYIIGLPPVLSVSGTANSSAVTLNRYPLFAEKVDYSIFLVDRNNDSTDFWTIGFDVANFGNSIAQNSVGQITTQGLTFNSYQVFTVASNTYLNVANTFPKWWFRLTKSGANTNRINVAATLYYRLVYL